MAAVSTLFGGDKVVLEDIISDEFRWFLGGGGCIT